MTSHVQERDARRVPANTWAPHRFSASVGNCLLATDWNLHRVTRRTLLLSSIAAAGAAAGCGDTRQLRGLIGLKPGLHVWLIGFPSSAVHPLTAALEGCAHTYTQVSRVQFDLQVQANPVPLGMWLQCPPVQPECTPAKVPRGSGQALPPVAGLRSMASQGDMEIALGKWLTAVGRTRLDVAFGAPHPVQPLLSLSLRELRGTDSVDIILAYDLWQFWLAPLASDVGGLWRLYTTETAGLPADIAKFGRFYTPARGTFAAAIPVLRNPMVLFPGQTFAARLDELLQAGRWTWPALASMVESLANQIDTGAFLSQDNDPDPTQIAAAMVASYGGALATTSGSTVAPAFADDPNADAAISMLMTLLGGGRWDAQRVSGGSVQGIGAGHLWEPLWGSLGSWGPQSLAYPLPAGPVATAAPCSYLCATIVESGRNAQLAAGFAMHLLSSTAQEQLSQAGVGLALRRQDAVAQIQQRHTSFRAPARIADAAGDLTLSKLFGGDKSKANATQVDATADAFAAALKGLESPPVSPDAVRALLKAEPPLPSGA